MKIIFLDIDGVLNCENGYKHKWCTKNDTYGDLFFPPSASLLNDLISETRAKIVISSTWRMSGLKQMQRMWKDRKMAGEVIDITPSIWNINNKKYLHNGKSKPINYDIPRGVEIDIWLEWKGFKHINWCSEKQYEYMDKSGIENYIIIDDDSDMLLKQSEHFVHVKQSPKNKNGFHLTNYYRALRILRKNVVDLNYNIK